MELRRLAVFVAIVKEGSFTSAADLLGISQPAVSQAVRALEVELGQSLFHRLGRSVRLTDAGTALCTPARLALRDVAAARAAVTAVHDLVAGHLELACLPTLAVAPLAPLVGAFRRAYPAITVELLDPEGTTDVLALVRSGQCELGLVADVFDASLVATYVADQEFRAILPPGVECPPLLRVEELGSMPMVAPPRGSSTRDLLDDVLARVGRSATVVVETAQREALVPLVLEGAGAALVPVDLARIAERLGCGIAQLAPVIARRVSLVHRDAELTPAAHAFRALAASRTD